MKHLSLLGLALIALAGCGRDEQTQSGPIVPRAKAVAKEPAKPATLTEARQGFKTVLYTSTAAKQTVVTPPPRVFQLVRYEAPVGKLAAYLSPDPKDGKKHPAIIWITGGDCNSIDDGCWTPGGRDDDQSASAYRKAGVVMMFPSLRGGNDNPGTKEGFLGEVDDVIAAADFLGKQDYVDPKRIYLGGHSTGGTLALLVSECTDRFRAVFSFGPVHNVAGYPSQFVPCDTKNPKEVEVRSPEPWLATIKSPTFVLEGTIQGNLDSLKSMAKASTNPKVQFLPVRRATHFSVLEPINRLLAAKVLGDTGAECAITLTEDEVNRAFLK